MSSIDTTGTINTLHFVSSTELRKGIRLISNPDRYILLITEADGRLVSSLRLVAAERYIEQFGEHVAEADLILQEGWLLADFDLREGVLVEIIDPEQPEQTLVVAQGLYELWLSETADPAERATFREFKKFLYRSQRTSALRIA